MVNVNVITTMDSTYTEIVWRQCGDSVESGTFMEILW